MVVKPRLRFAPSPTGSPHVGNIRTAVFDYLYARHTGGDFILRIEDTDRGRYEEGSLQEMMHCLRWMGMQWDEGPEVGGDFGPYFQSERLELYHNCVNELLEKGRAYRCYCSKERLDEMRAFQSANKLPPGYDRHCRDLDEAQRAELSAKCPNPVVRFKMEREGKSEFTDVVRGLVSFQNELEDDFVIIKADGFPTYHFASVVDDHHMEITHVIRGEEWLSSAPKHLQLYKAFGWTPPAWVHPPLILDETGKKLSKRSDTSTAFVSYVEEGYLPDAMLNFLATMGWSSGEDRKLFSRSELIEAFSLDGITDHPAVFDLARLRDLNGEYIRMMPVDELMELILPKLQQAGYISTSPGAEELDYLRQVTELVHDRLVTLGEAADSVSFFYQDDFECEQKGVEKHLKKEITGAVLCGVIANIEKASRWDLESIEAAVRGAAEELGHKPSEAIHRTRLALTGRTWGPGLFEIMFVIGKERCLERLRRCAQIDWMSR
jgi:glutamyl-tRNA synthetase